MKRNYAKTFTALSLVLLGLSFFLIANAESAGIDALLRAQQTADQQASYRIRTTYTEASGTAFVRPVEYVKPDRFHMQSGDSRGGGEIIVIGKDSYVRRGAGGAWQKSAMDMTAQTSGGRLTKEALATTEVTQVGPSNLEGTPMMVYTMTYAKDGMKSTGKLWIGVSDNLPHRSESDIEIPVTKVGSKSFGGKSHSVTLWEYNLKLEIKAPI